MLSQSQSKAIKIAVFLATIMVVMRHGQNLHLYYKGGSVWMPVTDVNIFIQEFISRFTDLAIPFFFMMSGFLYFMGVENFSQLKEKNIKRIRTLLIPFLLWNILELIFWGGLSFIPALHDQMVHSFGIHWSIGWVLKKLTLEPINGPFWYIRTLIIFCALSPVFLLIYRHKILALMCFGLLMRYWLFIDCRIFSTEGLVCFFLGGLIGYYRWHEKLEYHKWYWLLLLPLICTLTVCSIFRITFPGAWYLRIFLSVSFLIQFSLWCEKIPFINQKIESVSSKSFFIYAIHGNLLAGLSVVASRLLSHSPTTSMCMYFFGVATTVIIAVIVSEILQRFIPQAFRILTGGR